MTTTVDTNHLLAAEASTEFHESGMSPYKDLYLLCASRISDMSEGDRPPSKGNREGGGGNVEFSSRAATPCPLDTVGEGFLGRM